MVFTPTDCNKQFLTTEIIQTQIVKHFRPIDDFFNLTCMQMNLPKNQTTYATIVRLKLLTKLFSQHFVLT